MIETRGAEPLIHALGLVPSSSRATPSMRVGRFSPMQTQRTVDGAPTARVDARHVASGAAALGASSDRASCH